MGRVAPDTPRELIEVIPPPGPHRGGKKKGNMKIKYLKTGNYAFSPTTGPVQFCLAGHMDELPKQYAEMLIADKWAYVPESVLPPWKKSGWIADAENAKDILEDYVRKEYDLPLDKRRSVQNMIKYIKKMEKSKC